MANRTGRLFFALWPDQDVRGRILTVSEPWRTALRCRWTPPEKLHLTLAFLGDVAVEQLPVLEAIGQSLRADAPLVVTFGRLELWPRPQLLCLVGDTPEPLRGLVKALNGVWRRKALRSSGAPTGPISPWRATPVDCRKT